MSRRPDYQNGSIWCQPTCRTSVFLRPTCWRCGVMAPAQIAFTPDGSVLVVTEKSTNRLVTYTVGRNGRPGDPIIHDSAGTTPFGFAFGKRSQLLISDAFGGAPDASAVSSYTVSHQGELQFDGGLTLPNALAGETGPGSGPIDVDLANDGRFLYALSSAGGKIDAFRVQARGGLIPLPGVTVPIGSNGLAAR